MTTPERSIETHSYYRRRLTRRFIDRTSPVSKNRTNELHLQSTYEYAPPLPRFLMMHTSFEHFFEEKLHRPPRTRPARIKHCVMVLACLVGSHAYNLRGNSIHSQRHQMYIPANSFIKITAKSIGQTARCNQVESYDFDAIEEEVIREQSSQPNSKSIQIDAKKARKRRRRNGGRSLPAKPAGDRMSPRMRGRCGAKNFEVDSSEMPPWLTRYEGEDFSASSYLGDESQSISLIEPIRDDLVPKMQRLRLALNGIFHKHPTTDISAYTVSFPEVIPYFTDGEINEVMDAIRVASHGSSNLMEGCADFLYLMLTLEEEGMLNNGMLSSETWDDDDIGSVNDGWENGAGRGRPKPLSIVTRDILIAASFHYCDCVRARVGGVYDYARKAMEASLDVRFQNELDKKKQLWLPPGMEALVERGGDATRMGELEMVEPTIAESKLILARIATRKSAIDHYGEESVKIAAGAARLKRAEIMATTVNSSGSLTGVTNQLNDDAEILRSFLVSLSEDWRALVIRSVACLYRLKGIDEKYTQNSVNKHGVKTSAGSVVLSKTNIGVTRDAFRVYAPLAQRLGMQRLKVELENTAFRILYPRQFSMASSLYSRDIDEMKSIVKVLSSRIEQLLKSDSVFVGQIEDVAVTSRVKEPYSLWKKMIRFRKEAADAKNKASSDPSEQAPSLKWIPDMIALRVVLRALRLSPLEDDESLRTREKMLCYYAIQLISDVWPASTRNEAKDYIKHPKPNGYQSLHYTARLMIDGEEWPFEVQIRSEEMHRIAEFGVAAHWDYKLQNKAAILLPDKPLSHVNTTMLALRSEIQHMEEEVDTSKVVKRPSRDTQKGRIASYIDALTSSRESIVQNNLFFFISSTKSALDGKIVSIDPSAPNVADVLKKYGANINGQVIEDIAGGTLEIYRNGVMISLDEDLSNGDVLTLPHSIIDSLTI